MSMFERLSGVIASISEPEEHCLWLDTNDNTTYFLKAFYPERGIWDYIYGDYALENKIDKVPSYPNYFPIFLANGNITYSNIHIDEYGHYIIGYDDVDFSGDVVLQKTLVVDGDINAYAGATFHGDVGIQGDLNIVGTVTASNYSGIKTYTIGPAMQSEDYSVTITMDTLGVTGAKMGIFQVENSNNQLYSGNIIINRVAGIIVSITIQYSEQLISSEILTYITSK